MFLMMKTTLLKVYDKMMAEHYEFGLPAWAFYLSEIEEQWLLETDGYYKTNVDNGL